MHYPIDFNDGLTPEIVAAVDKIVGEHREVLRGRGERVDELTDDEVFEQWRDEHFAAMIRRFLGGEEGGATTLAEQVSQLRRRATDTSRELSAGGQRSSDAEQRLSEIQWLLAVAERPRDASERRQAAPKAEPPKD
jgi:hypothetical protein